jgi:Ca2+-transporting ATPase
LVILDDNFDNIRAAVEEGRSMYQTIRTSVLYLLSTNLGELLVIAVAVVLGWPLPLLATQIIWLNMVTDTFLVAALALEPKQRGLLSRRFAKPSPYLVDWSMGVRILLIGGVMTFGTLFMFKGALGGDMVKAWTIALTTLTVFQWYNIWNVRSNHQSIFAQNPFRNPWLIVGLALSIGLHMVAIYTPVMQKVLHTTGLSFAEWKGILFIALSVIVVEELRKLVLVLHAKSRTTSKTPASTAPVV